MERRCTSRLDKVDRDEGECVAVSNPQSTVSVSPSYTENTYDYRPFH